MWSIPSPRSRAFRITSRIFICLDSCDGPTEIAVRVAADTTSTVSTSTPRSSPTSEARSKPNATRETSTERQTKCPLSHRVRSRSLVATELIEQRSRRSTPLQVTSRTDETRCVSRCSPDSISKRPGRRAVRTLPAAPPESTRIAF